MNGQRSVCFYGWAVVCGLCVALAVGACSGSKGDSPKEGGATAESKTMSDQHGGRKANRLIHESSPYLLQHAYNPVDWHSWSAEAFARARKEDKPVFLSVGYSTCHWCHVMERESFENEEIARFLNEHFVAIKVDREQRPDIDRIYMNATQLLTGRGGWPNSLWLTAEGKPWYAGTYFPPEDRGGMPGFLTVLKRLEELWRTRRKDVETQAERLADEVKRLSTGRYVEGEAELDPRIVTQAIEQLRQTFDRSHGGWGGAPKFPPHGALELILSRAGSDRDAPGMDMALRTLDAMALGGIRDHLGGGFHRYSTDLRWLVPHFEKMLYDNAQLARAYVDAYRITGRNEYRQVAEGILDWVLREMTGPAGGFYSALDADSEGEEGKFYVWDYDEIIAAVGVETGELFCRAYGAVRKGNFEDEATRRRTGANILYLDRSLEVTAKLEQTPAAELAARLAEARGKLLAVRDRRVRPYMDDKVVTGWNGLMIAAMAHAGRELDRPDYVAAAERAGRFVLENLRKEGRLLRTWRKGKAEFNAYLDDYAFLADALIELHLATGQKRYLAEAEALMAVLDRDYRDAEGGGYFFTADDHEDLLARSKDPFDGAIPSGNGVAARVLVRLARRTGKDSYRQQARRMLEPLAVFMQRAPRGMSSTIVAAGMYFDLPAAAAAAGATARSARAPVAIEAVADRPGAAAGETLTIELRLTVDDGWHVNSAQPIQDYLQPTSVVLKTAGASLGRIDWPAGDTIPFGSEGERLRVYRGAVRVAVPVTIAADAVPGRKDIVLEVSVQPCDDRRCLAPQTHTLSIPVDVLAPAAAAAPS